MKTLLSKGTLLASVCLTLTACQPSSHVPNLPVEDFSSEQTAQYNEDPVLAQVSAAFLAANPGSPEPDVKLFEQNGSVRFYEANPSGLGGYILYSGAMNLYRFDEKMDKLEALDSSTGALFLGDYVTDISSDNQFAVGFATFDGTTSHIGARVTNLQTGAYQDYTVPNLVTQQAGAGVFSPDGSQLAFAVTEADQATENTTIYLVDLKTQKISEWNHAQGAVKLGWTAAGLEIL